MAENEEARDAPGYRLDEQVGFLLRRAHQRHRAIFAAEMPVRLPPTQFAALAKLAESGELSQNRLGRMTAMDSSTIAGVVRRLSEAGWVSTAVSSTDARASIVSLTAAGEALVDSLLEPALRASHRTLEPISEGDRAELMRLLERLGGSEGEGP